VARLIAEFNESIALVRTMLEKLMAGNTNRFAKDAVLLAFRRKIPVSGVGPKPKK
jgi:hypothetical protein